MAVYIPMPVSIVTCDKKKSPHQKSLPAAVCPPATSQTTARSCVTGNQTKLFPRETGSDFFLGSLKNELCMQAFLWWLLKKLSCFLFKFLFSNEIIVPAGIGQNHNWLRHWNDAELMTSIFKSKHNSDQLLVSVTASGIYKIICRKSGFKVVKIIEFVFLKMIR